MTKLNGDSFEKSLTFYFFLSFFPSFSPFPFPFPSFFLRDTRIIKSLEINYVNVGKFVFFSLFSPFFFFFSFPFPPLENFTMRIVHQLIYVSKSLGFCPILLFPFPTFLSSFSLSFSLSYKEYEERMV